MFLATIHAWSRKAYACMILSVCSVTTTWSLNLVRSEYTLQFTFKATLWPLNYPPSPSQKQQQEYESTKLRDGHSHTTIKSFTLICTVCNHPKKGNFRCLTRSDILILINTSLFLPSIFTHKKKSKSVEDRHFNPEFYLGERWDWAGLIFFTTWFFLKPAPN